MTEIDVQTVAAAHFGCVVGDILGHSRQGHLVRARWTAVWLCRRVLRGEDGGPASYQEVARWSARDWKSARDACEWGDAHLARDERFRADVSAILPKLVFAASVRRERESDALAAAEALALALVCAEVRRAGGEASAAIREREVAETTLAALMRGGA